MYVVNNLIPLNSNTENIANKDSLIIRDFNVLNKHVGLNNPGSYAYLVTLKDSTQYSWYASYVCRNLCCGYLTKGWTFFAIIGTL